MRLCLIALQFLTIIPIPLQLIHEEKDLGRAMAVFPLVGLLLGALLAGIDYLFSLRLPRQLVDLLLITFLAVVTGALHLDGVADVCDGIAARGGRERFLAVLKDSRTGAVGVVGLVLALLLKYQALLLIPGGSKSAALLFFPMVARFSQVQMTVWGKAARSDGLGSVFTAGAGVPQLAIAGVITGSSAWLLFGVLGVFSWITLCLFTCGLKSCFKRIAGGITGDIIGCVSELNEILSLILMVALLK